MDHETEKALIGEMIAKRLEWVAGSIDSAADKIADKLERIQEKLDLISNDIDALSDVGHKNLEGIDGSLQSISEFLETIGQDGLDVHAIDLEQKLAEGIKVWNG